MIINFEFHIDGLVQERHNSIANALEMRLSCTNPSIYTQAIIRGREGIMKLLNTFSKT